MLRLNGSLGVLVLSAAVAQHAPAAAQPGRMTVELNKLEDGDEGGCRSYFLFRNGTGLAFEGFEMSLAVLAGDGVIDRLLTIDAAPLPADRTSLRLFDIPGIACAEISEMILHDIPVCKPQNAEAANCYDYIELESRAPADIVR